MNEQVAKEFLDGYVAITKELESQKELAEAHEASLAVMKEQVYKNAEIQIVTLLYDVAGILGDESAKKLALVAKNTATKLTEGHYDER